MKNKNKFASRSVQYIGGKMVVFAIFFLLGVSCSDMLTEVPDSYYDTAKIFESTENAQLGLNGIYNALAGIKHYGQYEMAMHTSDDMYCINGTNQDGSRRDISHYQLYTSNAWISDLWSAKYKGLERANSVLAGLHGMDEYKKGNAEVLRMEGEAAFLRALYSLDLVKYWGDVPYKTEPTTFENSYLPCSSKYSIYTQIFADLTLATTDLEWATGTTNPERATQGAARALLMRAKLQYAGYALNSSTGVLECPSNDIRTSCFQDVVAEWEAFQSNGFHNFCTNGYEQLWKNYCENIMDPKESIFEIAFYTPDGTETTAGTWATYIGPIIDAQATCGRANGFFRVLPEWYAYYDTLDVRRDLNMCNFKIDANNNQVLQNTKTYYPGKWRRYWVPDAPKDPNNTDVNFVFLRYADVVLMAAEAYNELGNTSEAIRLINLVRARANAHVWDDAISGQAYADLYKAPHVADLDYIDDATLQGKIRTALYWERGFELCFEGTRKYDLLRWGILAQAIQLHKNTKLGSGYKAPTNFVSGKHELFPIPLNEMQVNSKLENKNNAGY